MAKQIDSDFLSMTGIDDNLSFSYVVEVTGREPLPPMRLTQTENRIDYGSANVSISLENREIGVKILVGTNGKSIQETYRETAKLFYTGAERRRYVFSDDPKVYWQMSLSSVEIDEEVDSFATIDLTYDAYPLSVDTEEQTVTGTNIISFYNSGTYPSNGQLSFTNNSTTAKVISITISDQLSKVVLKAETAAELKGNWVIDMQDRTVFKNNALSMQYIDQYASKWVADETDKFYIPALKSVQYNLSLTTAEVQNAKIVYKRRWL